MDRPGGMIQLGLGFDSVLESLEDAVCVIDRDLTIIFQNQSHRLSVGVHTGRRCYEAFFGTNTPCKSCQAAEVVRTGRVQKVRKMSGIDGDESMYEITATPVFGEGKEVIAIVEVAKDITGQLRHQRQVESAEELFRQMAENVPGVVWMRGAAHNEIIYLSPNFEKIWGMPREELYADCGLWLKCIHPDDLDGLLGLLDREVFCKPDTDDASYTAEYRIIRPDGGVRWIRSRGFSIKGQDGHVYRYAGIAEDITDAKDFEQQREDIFAMLRHDLKTPLSVMNANLDLVTQYLVTGKTGEVEPLVSSVRHKVKSLSSMIDDLSMIARSSSHIRRDNLKPHNLADVANEVLIFSREQASAKGIVLKHSYEDGLEDVLMDRVSIQRAITNLVQNAVKYTQPGGTVTVRVVKGCSCPEGVSRCQTVSVMDDGPGIPEKAHKRVFDKYFRLGEHGSGAGGTGLGLAIVKAVVEAHGGCVGLESEPGKGCAFHVTLPVIE